MKFVKNLYAKFSDKSKVDFKVTVFGDYEAGEASDLVELEDGEKLSDDLLKDKLDAFQWYSINLLYFENELYQIISIKLKQIYDKLNIGFNLK